MDITMTDITIIQRHDGHATVWTVSWKTSTNANFVKEFTSFDSVYSFIENEEGK